MIESCARAYYLSIAAMFDQGKEYGDPGDPYLMGKASGAKVYACDVAEMVCNRAMELMGAYGYTKE
jgi:alkylation response protein AidB-like acyl-CoA dehydrogenase